MAEKEEKKVEEQEEEKVKFKDLPYEKQIETLDEKITKTKERVEKLTKSLTKAKKDFVNLQNQRKAIMYDHDHPAEEEKEQEA